MAKNIQAPSDIRIASLDQKKETMVHNLMEPGPGTPWEDRGTHGLIRAFFRTCLMSLKSPVALFRSIRRPDTSSDATAFIIGCGLMWGIGSAIYNLALLPWYQKQPNVEVVTGVYLLQTALQIILAPVAMWLMLKLFCAFYLKMTSDEMRSKAPPVLMYNVFAYAAGPSILALIPLFGHIAAGIWIMALMMIAGVKRQYITTRGAVIGVILSIIAVGAIAIAAGFVLSMVWNNVMGGSVIVYPPVVAEGR